MMNNFIIKHFIKNHNDVNDAAVREKYGKLSGIVGIICNIFLCSTKIIAGLLFSSIAMVADGINNFADAASSVITLIGFRLSSKPADKDHPFGHARYEHITGLMISFLIIIMGLTILKDSIGKIFHPDKINFSMISICILIIAILIKLWLYNFNKQISKKIDSITIMATAKDSLNDVFSTGSVLLSILVGAIFNIQIDGFAGTVISVIILVSGVGLVNDTLSPLLGEAPKEELVKTLEKEIMSYKSIIGIHDLVVHNYGKSKCFATVHVEVPAKQSITVSHDIVDTIEIDIFKKYDIHLVVHMDPVETDNIEVLFLKEAVIKKISSFSSDLSIHDFRVVFGETHNNIIFDVVVPIDFFLDDKKVEEKICELIKEIDQKNNAVIQIDKKYYS